MKGAAERGGGEGPGARARVGDPGAGSALAAPCWSATLSWWPGAGRPGPGREALYPAAPPNLAESGRARLAHVGRPRRRLGTQQPAREGAGEAGGGRESQRRRHSDRQQWRAREAAARRKKRESWRQRGRDRPPRGDRAGGARGRSEKSWRSLVTTEEGDESHERGQEGGGGRPCPGGAAASGWPLA